MNGTDHVIFDIVTVTIVSQEPVVVMASVISTLIPDIDNGWSYFGSIAKLPIKHRGITHSLLFAVVVFAILDKTTDFQIAYGSMLGMICHDFADMLCGGCDFLFPVKTRIRLLDLKSNGKPLKLLNTAYVVS